MSVVEELVEIRKTFESSTVHCTKFENEKKYKCEYANCVLKSGHLVNKMTEINETEWKLRRAV